MRRRVRSLDVFDVQHPGLAGPFTFSTSSGLDTVGVSVQRDGLAAYETPVPDILIELIRSEPGLFLDVGANTGLYTLAAVAADRSVEAIAFEPLEPVRDLLRRNIKLNRRLAKRITIEPVGLSNETGTSKFYETINDLGFVSTSSSLDVQHVKDVGGELVERVVKTLTLDDYADTLGDKVISYMKIDVEGHEHAVIAGGRTVLARHRPLFTIEVLGPSEKAPIDDFLAEEDYVPFAMAPGVLRQRDSMMFFGDAWNHLLVPAEKINRVSDVCRTLGLRLERD